MKQWITIPQLGKLYVEVVLIYFDIPLLFVCRTENGVRYLVLCVDEEQPAYILVKVYVRDLLEMLLNKLPMEACFRQASTGKVWRLTYDKAKQTFNCEMEDIDKIPSNMLPDKGAFYGKQGVRIQTFIMICENEIAERNIKIGKYQEANYNRRRGFIAKGMGKMCLAKTGLRQRKLVQLADRYYNAQA